jgi:hypothetical protein
MSGARERLPRKRPAFEPAAALAPPVPHDPGMRRPASIVAGSVLVLLRAAAGVLWILSFVFGWDAWVQGFAGAFSGDASDISDLPDGVRSTVTLFVVGVVGLGVLLEATLGLLILRGTNWPRVLVMVLSTLSISSAFVGWWAQGQQIRIETTFVTLALDILILLALSSRSAAAYARRFERR